MVCLSVAAFSRSSAARSLVISARILEKGGGGLNVKRLRAKRAKLFGPEATSTN